MFEWRGGGEISPNFDLKNMILIFTKDFLMKKCPQLTIFLKQIQFCQIFIISFTQWFFFQIPQVGALARIFSINSSRYGEFFFKSQKPLCWIRQAPLFFCRQVAKIRQIKNNTDSIK
jgi:hypothetical protein